MTPKHLQKTLAEILEVSANPTREEVVRNYKRLVKQYHPDINKDPNAEAAMKLINRAYAIAIGKEKPPPQRPQPQPQPTVRVTYYYYGGFGSNGVRWTTSSSGTF